jgi:hypothetical protein
LRLVLAFVLIAAARVRPGMAVGEEAALSKTEAPPDTTVWRRIGAGPGADTATTVVLRAGTEPVPWHRQPKWIMLRSVVVPGWGQFANRKYMKAGVVAAGEGYLLWRAIDWGRKEKVAKREVIRHQDDPALAYHYQLEANYAGSRRRDFTWWTIFAAALSMGDAYVDAKLGAHFDAEFKPQDTSDLEAGKRGSYAFRVGLSAKLP